MKFGIFYEHQLPRPWNEGDEHRLFQEALDQVELADRLGIDYAWATLDAARLRVTVWVDNERALKVIRALGFEAVDRFTATTTQEDYLILTLLRPQRSRR